MPPETPPPRTEPVYSIIAQLLIAIENCEKRSDPFGWRDKHRNSIERIIREYLPSGSGIDNGTQIDWGRSNPDRLVFDTSFHHMNEHGYYDGWTEHTITVRPSLAFGIAITISGRDRNEIKDYLHDCYDHSLRQTIEWPTA